MDTLLIFEYKYNGPALKGALNNVKLTETYFATTNVVKLIPVATCVRLKCMLCNFTLNIKIRSLFWVYTKVFCLS